MTISVVIADDEALIRSGLQLMLESQPDLRVVAETDNGLDAVDLASSLRPDVILMDICIPRLDGVQATRRLRRAGYTGVIVALTARAMSTDRERCIDAGCDEFLAKPISAKALYSRLTSIIDCPRPFIRTKSYFGPCRRRRNLGAPRGMQERRADELEKPGIQNRRGSYA